MPSSAARSLATFSASSNETSSAGVCMYRLGTETSPVATPLTTSARASAGGSPSPAGASGFCGTGSDPRRLATALPLASSPPSTLSACALSASISASSRSIPPGSERARSKSSTLTSGRLSKRFDGDLRGLNRDRFDLEISDQDVERVASDSDRNFWMDAPQALEYGLVSSIITSASEVD